jgi:hypothetical protein
MVFSENFENSLAKPLAVENTGDKSEAKPETVANKMIELQKLKNEINAEISNLINKELPVDNDSDPADREAMAALRIKADQEIQIFKNLDAELMKIDTQIANLEKEEEIETDTTKQEIEYRDTEGKLIGKVLLEMGANTPEGRQLKSLKLVGEKNGLPTEIDVLELTNPHGVKITIAEDIFTGSYNSENKSINVRPLEYPHDLAVLLHELGHADQSTEPEFMALWDQYGEHPDPSARPTEWLRNDFKNLAKSMPGIDKYLPGEEFLQEHGRLMQGFEPLTKERDSLASQIEILSLKLAQGPEMKMRALKEYLTPTQLEARREEYKGYEHEAEEIKREIAPLSARAAEVDSQIDDLKKKIKEMTDNTDLKKLLSAPTSILERDATKRALLWMRKIREKAGVDLFKSSEVPKERIGLSTLTAKQTDTCENSMGAGIANPEDTTREFSSNDFLMHSLDTYKARKNFRVKPKGKEKIGFMPNVKSKGARSSSKK